MATAAEHTRTYRARKRAIFQSFKNERGCQECGEKHPATLDLHHRDESEKHPWLVATNAKKRGWDSLSITAIEAELQKCDVLCSNCHRILEANKRASADQGA